MPIIYSPDDLAKVHELELAILEAIDHICRAEGIDYVIDSGTCLGAVRHGGFIPWDDDIDIAMPEDDYYMFLHVAKELLPKNMSLHTALDTQGFAPLWAKVWLDGTTFMDSHCVEAGCPQGLFVDVFPFFRLDRDEKKARLQRKRCRTLQQKSYFHWYSNPAEGLSVPFPHVVGAGCALIHHTVARFWSPSALYKSFYEAAHSDDPGELWFSAAYPNVGALPDDILFPTSDITFESLTVRGPADPDAYLKLEYGDYMTLPPEEKRHTHAPSILKL